MNRKYTDEERFQLDIPPEQEDTRAEDEYNQEGLFYNDLNKIITGYEKHGVFRDHKSSVARVLEMLLQPVCAHYWVQDLEDNCKYFCVKCGVPQNVDAKTMNIDNRNSRLR
jgi:hypothetical protein